MKRTCLALVSLFALTSATTVPTEQTGGVNDALILAGGYPKLLSQYRFFTDDKANVPNHRVVPYNLNTPLFTDYAGKDRFVYVPEGKRAKPNGKSVFEFPVGSALIKSFGYSETGLLETRLLLRREKGWVALPYVWNETRTDAVLKRGGKRIDVSFKDPSGEERQISYAVPNQNQCKSCHALKDEIVPIGPKPRNMDDGVQLQGWVDHGVIASVPKNIEVMPNWKKYRKASLDQRARAYLDINCAHCHNRDGAASNSGLFLEFHETDRVAMGIGKRPVAAGRGSGGRDFDIAVGAPGKSILLYRMESNDPGIAMPELGRGIVHKEGISIIKDWIASMEVTSKPSPAK